MARNRRKRFNSLQTGRCFRTLTFFCSDLTNDVVSIPFKREGVSELAYLGTLGVLQKVSIPFKREGVSERNTKKTTLKNLKVSIPFKREGVSELSFHTTCNCFRIFVSIPFKREGVSEQNPTQNYPGDGLKFQFPSNGKVFPNTQRQRHRMGTTLTFQFPSNGKVFPNVGTVLVEPPPL